VSDWTTFATAQASRVDLVTTVRYASVVQIEVQLGIPVDAGCRIQIRFPGDMPLTTDLT